MSKASLNSIIKNPDVTESLVSDFEFWLLEFVSNFVLSALDLKNVIMESLYY